MLVCTKTYFFIKLFYFYILNIHTAYMVKGFRKKKFLNLNIILSVVKLVKTKIVFQNLRTSNEFVTT